MNTEIIEQNTNAINDFFDMDNNSTHNKISNFICEMMGVFATAEAGNSNYSRDCISKFIMINRLISNLNPTKGCNDNPCLENAIRYGQH